MHSSRFLTAAFAGVLTLATACGGERTPERPNILFLFADDHRADAIAAYGNPDIRTPTLDRLSREGFDFRRAYVMGSHHGAVCAPSRAMLMSGRSLFHVYDNLDTVKTFPELLRADGYVTFGTGKWHQSRESFARSFAEGRHVFFGGMSDHEAVPVRTLGADGAWSDPDSLGFSTDLFADAAIEFIRRRARADDPAPFLAYVSFTAPHDPRTPPRRWLDEYAGTPVSLPPNFMPIHQLNNGWMTGRDERLAPWPRPPDMIEDQIREYYGLVSHMDERIGDILDALREEGLAASTLVVYAADNGLALGSHGLMGKQSLYEHSSRVPLIVAGPGIPTGQSDALVTLYDLFPTITGLAGVTAPADIDGFDLSPIWSDDAGGVRDDLYTAYEDLMRSVTDGRFKLIRYPRLDYEQLFDLAADRHELRNTVSRPLRPEILERLRNRMQELHREFGDPHPLRIDSLDSPLFDPSVIDRTPDRHQPDWVVRKYFGE